MGYTHYWTRKRILDRAQWDEFMTVNRVLLAKLPTTTDTAGGCYAQCPLTIGGPHGNEPSEYALELSGTRIAFNGTGHDPDTDEELDHESFLVERVYKPEAWEKDWHRKYDKPGYYSAFCKTARKPYDLLVCAILLNAAHTFGDAFTVTSDGDAREWVPACRYYQAVTERNLPANGPWHDAPAQRSA